MGDIFAMSLDSHNQVPLIITVTVEHILNIFTPLPPHPTHIQVSKQEYIYIQLQLIHTDSTYMYSDISSHK